MVAGCRPLLHGGIYCCQPQDYQPVIKHSKIRNFNANFPPKQGTGLNPLIPFISEGGREIMKQMIVYDPESRINIRRLIEHKYFIELRQKDVVPKHSFCSVGGIPTSKTSWRNPVFLSYITNEKRKKQKASKEEISKIPKLCRSNESSKLNVSEMPKMREQLGDWKTNRTFERFKTEKYDTPSSAATEEEAQFLKESTKENDQSKQNLIKKKRFLPPLVGAGSKKSFLQPRVESVIKFPALSAYKLKSRSLMLEGGDKKGIQLSKETSKKQLTRNIFEAYRSLQK